MSSRKRSASAEKRAKEWKMTPEEQREMFARIAASHPSLNGENRFRNFSQVFAVPGVDARMVHGLLGANNALALGETSKNMKKLVDRDLKDLGDKPLARGKTLRQWRERFPTARQITVSRRKLTNEDLECLAGVPIVNISGCYCSSITDAGWRHLEGIAVLDISRCEGITDAALAHLKGIHTLDITRCKAVSDTGLAHLKGIHTLNMSYCDRITDAGLEHLKGIHTLNMTWCDITDAGLEHLRGIHTLDMSHCVGITGVGFEYLRGINTITLTGNDDMNRAMRRGPAILAGLGCDLEYLYEDNYAGYLTRAALDIYGVTPRNPKVTRYPASCGGGSGGGTRRNRQKRKVSTRKR